MSSEQMYGCLYCKTGSEKSIAEYIREAFEDVETVVPMRLRRKKVDGKVIEDFVQLLPGYLFFRTVNASSAIRLPTITNVYRLLEYENRNWQLIDHDRAFAEFLFENDLRQVPIVKFINGRLHFEDGFLQGYDEQVLRVNRRKQTAEVQLKISNLSFWIGYNETNQME